MERALRATSHVGGERRRPAQTPRRKPCGFLAWLFVQVAAAAAVSAPNVSFAHGGVDEDRSPPESGAAPVAQAEASTESPENSEPRRTQLGLDLVLGWGRVPFAVQNLPTTGSQAITYTRSDATASDVQSFLLAGSYELRENLGLELALPFAFATFSPSGSAARSTTAVGNVEVAGEWRARLGSSAQIAAALGVAAPTAQGQPLPQSLVAVRQANVDEQAYDRFSLARACAFSRGYEDNALFEVDRLGLVPRVGLLFGGQRLSLEPYAKVENLLSVRSAAGTPYVGELVVGVRVSYRLSPHIEAAVRGWANAGFAGAADDLTTAVAIEPDALLAVGLVRARVGVVVPLAGPPEQAGFFGVRLGLMASF
jgi:hypothetical protein